MTLLLKLCGITENCFFFFFLIIIVIFIFVIISYRRSIEKKMNLGAPNLANELISMPFLKIYFLKDAFRVSKKCFSKISYIWWQIVTKFCDSPWPSHREQLVASLLAYSWSALPQIAFSRLAQHWVSERDNFDYI